MSKARFTEEFKVAAVKQVAEHGRPVAEVAARLGVCNLFIPLFSIKQFSLNSK